MQGRDRVRGRIRLREQRGGQGRVHPADELGGRVSAPLHEEFIGRRAGDRPCRVAGGLAGEARVQLRIGDVRDDALHGAAAQGLQLVPIRRDLRIDRRGIAIERPGDSGLLGGGSDQRRQLRGDLATRLAREEPADVVGVPDALPQAGGDVRPQDPP